MRRQVLGDDYAGAPPTIGRFRLEALIGRGGMSIVYQAHDPQLDRRVAIKMLTTALPTSSERMDAIAREARALARLSHAHVLQVHEIGRFQGLLFLVLEYVDGVHLRRWLEQQPPPGRAAIVEIFCQAGAGLARAHALGICHRDFKPENVLVDAAGTAKVADFGLASFEHELEAQNTGQRACPGTPRYMAPEQRRGRAQGAASDQYSFCLALLECLQPRQSHGSTRRPIQDPLATLAATRQLPRRIRRALARGLSEDPAARWPNMDQLLRQLSSPGHRTPARWALLMTTMAALGYGLAPKAADGDGHMRLCHSYLETANPGELDEQFTALHRRLTTHKYEFALESAALLKQEFERAQHSLHDQRTQLCADPSTAAERPLEQTRLRLDCLASAEAGVATTLAALDPQIGEASLEVAVEAIANSTMLVEDCRNPQNRRWTPQQTHALPQASGDEERASTLFWRGRAAGWTGQGQLADELLGRAESQAQADPQHVTVAVAAARLRAQFALQRDDLATAETALARALAGAETHRLQGERLRVMILHIRLATKYRVELAAARTHAHYARQLAETMTDQPLDQAELQLALAELAVAQADLSTAESRTSTALRLLQSHGASAWTHARALWQRGEIRGNLRKFELADADYLAASQLLAQHSGHTHPDQIRLLKLRSTLAFYLSNNIESTALARRALKLSYENLPPGHPELGDALCLNARIELRWDHLEEAVRLGEQGLKLLRQHPAAATELKAKCMNRVAVIYKSAGQTAAAWDLITEAESLLRQHFPGPHRLHTFPLLNSASILNSRGEVDRAMARLQQALANEEQLYGKGHSSVEPILRTMAKISRSAGRVDDARHYELELGSVLWQNYRKQSTKVGAGGTELQYATRKWVDHLKYIGHSEEAMAVHKRWLNSVTATRGTTMPDVSWGEATIRYVDLLAEEGQVQLAWAHWQAIADDLEQAVADDEYLRWTAGTLQTSLLARLGPIAPAEQHLAAYLTEMQQLEGKPLQLTRERLRDTLQRHRVAPELLDQLRQNQLRQNSPQAPNER